MALEKSLWQRVKKGALSLRSCGYKTHSCRIENDAGEGNPDVEMCIDGTQLWIELKSHMRPARASTAIRFKVRPSQSIWHRMRSAAGCRHNFVLAQVGEAHEARLYLIPGSFYDEIVAPEARLAELSILSSSDESVREVLLRACEGY